MAAHLSILALNRMLDTLNTELGATPKLIAYNGTQPATADTALSGNTVLATIPLPTNPFGTAAARVIALSASADDTSADASGTTTWASFTKTDGTTRVLDVASPADLDWTTEVFTIGELIRLSTFTLTMPA